MLNYKKGTIYPLHYNILRHCRDSTSRDKLPPSDQLFDNQEVIGHLMVFYVLSLHILHLRVVNVSKHP